ncbi:hypothetical protein Psuf_020270 [Phytohabitans suffuscus]|uniref:ABC transporter domain-containing protein n=1 Tax=Phytohabitans suffuscus TaxID=624315 RepID=A0A6F8YF01_9ACTN|nr:hypothetical protein Psuf_020270 [Phytohabitans suffuscus]
MAQLRGIPVYGHAGSPRGGLESSPDRSGAEVRLYRVTRRRPRGRGRHAGTVTALDDVTLSVPAGQAVALAGPSGSGKSTLLRLASAQDRPDAGSVIVDGVRIESLTSRQATRFRRRIGVVSHDSRLMSALTAAENVMFPCSTSGSASTRTSGRCGCSTRSAWRSGPRSRFLTCPAGSSSGSCWRVPWPTGRAW